MKVFLTGANGWIGSAVALDLLAAGHAVAGLVCAAAKGEALAAAGGTPLVGALADLDLLRDAAAAADAVVHTAFGLDFADIAALAAEDVAAIEAFGAALAGSDRPLLVTGGVGLATDGETLVETDRPPMIPDFPRASEQTAFALAGRGVAAGVVRLPRSVHGQGEAHGFVPMLATVAREKGFSAWIGDGANRWPAVHRLDAARVYRLAIERGARDGAYHAIAEEGVRFRQIAEAIGRQLGLPARSLPPEQAEGHFGPLAVWVAGDGPASGARTQALLGWRPRERMLIEDIKRPDYSA